MFRDQSLSNWVEIGCLTPKNSRMPRPNVYFYISPRRETFMTKCFLFMILSVCFVLLLVPAFAAASADHGDRVCIYKHDNFHGHEQCYRAGEEVSDLKH